MNNFQEALAILSKQLNVTVDKIYPILQKQAQFHFATDIAWIVVSAIVILVSIALIGGFVKSKSINNDDIGFLALILIVVIIIFICIMSMCANEAMQIYINPDWYIFKNVIQTLKN